MLKFFALLLLLPLSYTPANASPSDTAIHDFQAIEIQTTLPLFGDHFYRIFFKGNFVIYHSQYQFDSIRQKVNNDAAGNFLSSEPETVWSGKRNRFFVFHRDSSYGYRFDADRDDQRVMVDSALREIVGTNNFENLLTKVADSIQWNETRTELMETYIQPATRDTPEVRCHFYYSSHLNHLKESFNKKLDEARKMKLYKVEYIIEEFYWEKEKKLIPKMNYKEEMKELRNFDPEEIQQYVDRYKKVSKQIL